MQLLINKNPIYRNIIWNMAFVIIGYGLASLTDMKSNIVWQPLKVLFLLYSMLRISRFYQNDIVLKKVYIFSILVMLTIPFSVNVLGTLKRVFVMILPMIYVAASLRALFLVYSWDNILMALLKSFRWIFVIPSISFILFGGDLSQTDMYGEVVGAFVSNHYGWGAFMVITSHWLLIQFKEVKVISVWTGLAIFNFFLLLISGSRSGLLSILVAFAFWFFSKRGHIVLKLGVTVVFIYLTISLLNSDSALSERLYKTQTQLEVNEENTDDDYYSNSAYMADSRATARAIASLAFINNPQLYFTGMGIFAFRDGLHEYAPWADANYYRSGIHSSYLEIYFGSGILVFAFFLWYFTLKPLLTYLKYFRNKMLFYFGATLIIPFFESNITAGQFMFYPWFISIFFLMYFKENIDNKPEKNRIIKSN